MMMIVVQAAEKGATEAPIPYLVRFINPLFTMEYR